MADATFSFELEGSADPALEQADALEQLSERIREGTAGLAGMNAAFRALKGSAHASSDSFKALKDRIAAQKAAIANSHAEYLKLGGDFKNLKKPTQDTTSGFEAFLSKIRSSGGPLAKFEGSLSSIRSLGASGVIGAGFAGIAVAVVALTAAVIVATAALFKFGIAMADAVRAERLQLEGLTKIRNWYGLAADKAGFLQETISKVSATSALGRDQINGMAVSLYKAGLRGGSLQHALEGVATATSAAGEEQGNFYKAWFIGAARSGQATKKLADDIKARFGGVAKAQLLSLDTQTKKLHESFTQLFSGLKIDGFLDALHDVTELFSQNTFSGRALKTIIEALFQPMIDFVSGNGILVKRFFQGLVIGALLLTIAILKVRNYLRSAFGDSEILKGLDLQKAAVYAGAAAIGALVGALAFLGIVLLVAFAPMIQITAVLAGFAYGIYRAYKAVTSIDWAGAGKSLIDGLVNGIKGGARWVIDAISNLADKAMKTLKSKLGIASPSKVFAKFGNFTAQGFAQGVDDGAGDVESAVGGMGGGAMAAAPAGGGGGGRGFGRSAPVINVTINIEGGGGKAPDQSVLAQIRDAVRDGINQGLESVAIQLGAEVPV